MEKSRAKQSDCKQRQIGLPPARPPQSKPNKNLNVNVSNNCSNCNKNHKCNKITIPQNNNSRPSNDTRTNKNIQYNKNNNNCTQFIKSQGSTPINNRNLSNNIISDKNNTYNDNNKTSKVNNNANININKISANTSSHATNDMNNLKKYGGVAVGTNNNTSRNPKNLNSTINSNKSEVKNKVSSATNKANAGGGDLAEQEVWPCPTPCPTRCPSLEEENTYEFRQAKINAAINAAMNTVNNVTQKSATAALVDAAKQIQEQVTKIKNIKEEVKLNSKDKIEKNGVQQESEPERLPRVAISLRDGTKSQFLKIRKWHINKKKQLVLDCSLQFDNNEGAVRMEVSETPSVTKTDMKSRSAHAMTDGNVVANSVIPTMVKSGRSEPTFLPQPTSLDANYSEKALSLPSDVASATTSATSLANQLPDISVVTSPPMTLSPDDVGFTLTLPSPTSKEPTLIPLPLSMIMANHTTMIPLNAIAMEQPSDGSQDSGLKCLWRKQTSLEDLVAILQSSCAAGEVNDNESFNATDVKESEGKSPCNSQRSTTGRDRTSETRPPATGPPNGSAAGDADKQKEMEKKLKDILEEIQPKAKKVVNKPVPQETPVEAIMSETEELNEIEGGSPKPVNLPRVAISISDGPKCQLLKIRQWHINSKGRLALDCSMQLGDNEGGVKMEESEEQTTKDFFKCHTALEATENEAPKPVSSEILKTECTEPIIPPQTPSLHADNSEKPCALSTDQRAPAQETSKSTPSASQLSAAAAELTPTTTTSANTTLKVKLTFSSPNETEADMTATSSVIPIPVSMVMANHTTKIPLNAIAVEQRSDGDQVSGVQNSWRSPASLEDLMAMLESSSIDSSEVSSYSNSDLPKKQCKKPRKKPVAYSGSSSARLRVDGLRRRASWRRPCSVFRALAAALRIHTARFYGHCAQRHGASPDGNYKDAAEKVSYSEDQQQSATDDDVSRPTSTGAEYQHCWREYQWDESKKESRGEFREKSSPERARSSRLSLSSSVNVVLVDTGTMPATPKEGSHREPSPVESVPFKCPVGATESKMNWDSLSSSAESIPSHETINQHSIVSITRNPSATCKTLQKQPIKVAPKPPPVKEAPKPPPVKEAPKPPPVKEAPKPPPVKEAPKPAPVFKIYLQPIPSLTDRTNIQPLKTNTMNATRSLLPSAAEKRGDKRHAAPVRPQPETVKSVHHSPITHKERAPRPCERICSTHRCVSKEHRSLSCVQCGKQRSLSRQRRAKHRSLSDPRRAKHRSVSAKRHAKLRSLSGTRRAKGRSVSRPRRAKRRSKSRSHHRNESSQSNSHPRKPRRASELHPRKKRIPSVSNRKRSRSSSQLRRRKLCSTPETRRRKSRSKPESLHRNQPSTSSSIITLNRSRPQSKKEIHRSTSKTRGAPCRPGREINRAQPSGSSRRQTTNARVRANRRQKSTLSLRGKAGQRVGSTRREKTQTPGKKLSRLQELRLIKELVKRGAYYSDSGTSLTSGTSQGSTVSRSPSTMTAGDSDDAWREYYPTRDPAHGYSKSIPQKFLRYVYDHKGKSGVLASRLKPYVALAETKSRKKTLSRSRATLKKFAK